MFTSSNGEYYLGFLKAVFDQAYLITIAVGVVVGLAAFVTYADFGSSIKWGAAIVASISGLDYVMRGSNPERKSEYNRFLIFASKATLAMAVAFSV